jgi:hypothetical protein
MKLKGLIISVGLVLGVTSTAYAYSPIPLSPTWFTTTFSAIQIAKAPVFRGKVVSINGPKSLLVQKDDGSKIVVNLFHTHITGEESPRQIERQKNALQQFVGYTWYIRGDGTKNNIDGIFLTDDGENANMILVYSGLFDLNKRSLIYSYDKEKIKTKYEYMQNLN